MSFTNTLPSHLRPCREKLFGAARGIPLDRNAKARIIAYARAYSARMKLPGQHRGPITRAFIEVLETLLWGFRNSKDGRCFPSYESIAARARCNRDTVYEAIKALEYRDPGRPLNVCAVTRRRFSSGCEPHPANAPAGSNRSSHGGDEMAEAFGVAGHV